MEPKIVRDNLQQTVNTSSKDEEDDDIIFLDTPSKPEGPLKVSDVHAKGCKLKWNKPKNEGGSPITGYAVESMMENWIPVGMLDKDKTEIPILGLDPGRKYSFRVKALNDEGESVPLQTERPILAKNPVVEPKIVRDNLQQTANTSNKDEDDDDIIFIGNVWNDVRESGPLETEPPLAKNPFDEPGPSGLLENKDYETDFVELKCDPSLKDGGASITGYSPEEVPVKDTEDEPRPPGLPQNKDYETDFVELKYDPPLKDGGASITGYSPEGVPVKDVEDEPGTPGSPENKDYETDFVELKCDPPLKDIGNSITGYSPEGAPVKDVEDEPGTPRSPENKDYETDFVELKYDPPLVGASITGYSPEGVPVKIVEDEPRPPGLPQNKDYETDFVVLKCDPPLKDGGASITGYSPEEVPVKDAEEEGVQVECLPIGLINSSTPEKSRESPTSLEDRDSLEYEGKNKRKSEEDLYNPDEPGDLMNPRKQLKKCKDDAQDLPSSSSTERNQ